MPFRAWLMTSVRCRSWAFQFFRLAALACGVRYATARLLPQGQRRYADRYAVGLLAAAVAVCSGVPRAAMNTALTVGTAALLVFMTGYGAFREDVYAKKNG